MAQGRATSEIDDALELAMKNLHRVFDKARRERMTDAEYHRFNARAANIQRAVDAGNEKTIASVEAFNAKVEREMAPIAQRIIARPLAPLDHDTLGPEGATGG